MSLTQWKAGDVVQDYTDTKPRESSSLDSQKAAGGKGKKKTTVMGKIASIKTTSGGAGGDQKTSIVL